MKPFLLTLAITLTLSCQAQSQFSVKDTQSLASFMDSFKHPLWQYSPKSEDTSWHFPLPSSVFMYRMCDSLLLLNTDRDKPFQDYFIYILSAKTGKLIRKQRCNSWLAITDNGKLYGTADSLLIQYDTYSGKIERSFNVNDYLERVAPHRICFYIENLWLYDSVAYITVAPDFYERNKLWRKKDDVPLSKQLPKIDYKIEKKYSYLIAINTHTGKPIGRHNCTDALIYAYGDTAILGTDSLYAVDMVTDKPLWHHKGAFIGNFGDTDTHLVSYRDNYYFYKTNGSPGYGIIYEPKLIGNSYVYTDTAILFELDHGLKAYSSKNLAYKWKVSNEKLLSHGVVLNNYYDDGVLRCSCNGYVLIADSNSYMMCLDEQTGYVKWMKNFKQHIYSPNSGVWFIPHYIIATMGVLHGVYASDVHTEIINPETGKSINSQKEFSVVLYDNSTQCVYVYLEADGTLEKIQLRASN